jgi:hypothetical protein
MIIFALLVMADSLFLYCADSNEAGILDQQHAGVYRTLGHSE